MSADHSINTNIFKHRHFVLFYSIAVDYSPHFYSFYSIFLNFSVFDFIVKSILKLPTTSRSLIALGVVGGSAVCA